MGIKCCKDCMPPKRHSGCHSKCEQYLKEKAEWEKEKEAIKRNMEKTPSGKYYEMNKIAFADRLLYKKERRKRKRRK